LTRRTASRLHPSGGSTRGVGEECTTSSDPHCRWRMHTATIIYTVGTTEQQNSPDPERAFLIVSGKFHFRREGTRFVGGRTRFPSQVGRQPPLHPQIRGTDALDAACRDVGGMAWPNLRPHLGCTPNPFKKI
jgi:hypothetical protein